MGLRLRGVTLDDEKAKKDKKEARARKLWVCSSVMRHTLSSTFAASSSHVAHLLASCLLSAATHCSFACRHLAVVLGVRSNQALYGHAPCGSEHAQYKRQVFERPGYLELHVGASPDSGKCIRRWPRRSSSLKTHGPSHQLRR